MTILPSVGAVFALGGAGVAAIVTDLDGSVHCGDFDRRERLMLNDSGSGGLDRGLSRKESEKAAF